LSEQDRGSGVDVGLWGGLWATGLLFHYAVANDKWHLDEPIHVFAAACFALLLAKPRWSIAWTIAALAQISDGLFTAVTRNDIQMSWTIVAATHVAMLLALSTVWHRPEEERAQAALDRLAPSLRGVVLLVYFYAVFHKLNRGYFSSVNDKPVELLERMPGMNWAVAELGLGDWGAHIGIGIEAVALVLLLIPSLRLLGVLAAFSLHFGLGVVGFRQFLIMFPLLLLFLRASSQAPPRWPERVRRVLPFVLPPALTAFLLANESRDSWTMFLTPLFVLGGAVFVFEVVRRVREHGPLRVGALPIGPGRPLDVLLPVLFAAWCFLPYLGVTTHPCMTMYSRLSVHSGESNHYLVPAALQIDAIHGDMVKIIGTSSPRRFPLAAEVPRLSLRKQIAVTRLRGKPPRWVIYRHGDQEIRVTDGRIPDAAWYERLPMISFNGPSALGTAKRRSRFNPRPRPVRALGEPPSAPAPSDSP